MTSPEQGGAAAAPLRPAAKGSQATGQQPEAATAARPSAPELRVHFVSSSEAEVEGQAQGNGAAPGSPTLKALPPAPHEFCLQMGRDKRRALSEALVQDTLSALPVKPTAVSNVQGPFVEVSRVGEATADVQVVHQFRLHFDKAAAAAGGDGMVLAGADGQGLLRVRSSGLKIEELHDDEQQQPGGAAVLVRQDSETPNGHVAANEAEPKSARDEGDKRFNTTLAQLHSGPVPLATSPAATNELSSSKSGDGGNGASTSNVRDEGSSGNSSHDAGGASTADDSSGAGTGSGELAGVLCCVEQPGAVSPSLAPWRGSQWELDPEQIKIGKRIAVGGFAEVFLGKYQGTLVAVKLLVNVDATVLERFMREVQLLAGLRHPNLLLFMGYTTRPHLAIVSEYMNRGSLFDVLRKGGNQPLEPRLQRVVAMGVARGMAYLHTRTPPLLHLDLKSPNILVDNSWRIKIADFGLSRFRHHTFVSAGAGAGTPQWMAPEVLRSEQFGEAADVWSFGVVLWEVLTGHIPWEGVHPMAVVGAVGFRGRCLPLPSEGDPFLIDLCRQCMSPDPSQRPSFPSIVQGLEEHYAPMQHASLSTSLSKASLCLDRDPSAGWGVGRDLPYPRARPQPPLLLPAPPAPASAEAGQSSSGATPTGGGSSKGKRSGGAVPSRDGINRQSSGGTALRENGAGDGRPAAGGQGGSPFAAAAVQAMPSAGEPGQVGLPAEHGDHGGTAQQHGQAAEQLAAHAGANGQHRGLWPAQRSMTNESPFAQMRLSSPRVQPGSPSPASCSPPQAHGNGSESEAGSRGTSGGMQSRGAASPTAALPAAAAAAAQAARTNEESLPPAQLPTLSLPKQPPSAELPIEADGSGAAKAAPAPSSPQHVLAVPVSRGTTVEEGESLGTALAGLHLAGQ